MNIAGARENECRKPKRVTDSAYLKEKMLLCKQDEKGVPLQVEQYDWLADTDEEIDEQELEAHYSYMENIHEVPTADSGTDSEPLEQDQVVQKKPSKNVQKGIFRKGHCVLSFCKGQQYCVLVPAFWLLRFVSCDFVLHFGSAFSLIEDLSCVLLRRDSAQFKTYLRFVSRVACVLSQDFLRFVSRLPAFCLKASCVLPTFEDLLCVLGERNSGKKILHYDMDILIKTCLMPLALKTQNDSFIFVHELKQKMHADLKYVESFEKEIDELEYDKAQFSDMYDIILQE
nr:hypothetical protein [Tanacetum cinerariifolium]